MPEPKAPARLPRLRAWLAFWLAIAAMGIVAWTPATAAPPVDSSSGNHGPPGIDLSQRAPQDEVIYFLLPDRFANGDPGNDRGGLRGDRMQTGFDPTDPGFYQGGDLKGLTDRLDYIQGLGATAIWLGPIYKNMPVQGRGTDASAGYHGYWITDFLSVDPHFGSAADMRAFVRAAHARGMKVYLDIILNHTADVISYRECPHDQPINQPRVNCSYRSIADFPWTRRGGVMGPEINPGFRGVGASDQTPENFAKLNRFDWAYTPYIPRGAERIKNPPWLNDIRHYHLRGDTTFVGEDSLFGDFGGLDDLMTEDPVVVQGMIDIFKFWISEYRVDGFRIDTIKHAQPALWRAFLPAMQEHAKKEGIANFYMFGEAYDYDSAALARFTREDGFQAVLDFPFQGAVSEFVIQGKPARVFEKWFAADQVYAYGTRTAAILPTFLSNHDMGRFAGALSKAHPQMSDTEKLQRLKLAHAIMMSARGVPVIYSGDEQGFNSDGNDRQARETLFASQVTSWNDNDLIGTVRTNAVDNYDTSHPLYVAIAELARIRANNRALRRGDQRLRLAEDKGGLLVFSRIDPDSGQEFVIAANAETKERRANVVVEANSLQWTSVSGVCASRSNATTSYTVTVPPLSYIVCASTFAPTKPTH
jgi:glycosidase